MYKLIIRPFLFIFNPETAHRVVIRLLQFNFSIPGIPSLFKALFDYKHESLKREVFGLTFKNPVGLAAGFDKNAEVYKALSAFGFGFIEIGTVTPIAQTGNSKPRIFRLKQDEALINRLGFNNKGMDWISGRLSNKIPGLIIGANIGKNKSTDNSNAKNDYLLMFQKLYDHVDYFTINISSPNTPGLRELQKKENLIEIITTLKEWESTLSTKKPLLIKLAPDLTTAEIDDIIDVVLSEKIDGIVAVNTTINREGLASSAKLIDSIGEGGLSGKPLQRRSTEMIRYIRSKVGNELPIIGVGGINDESSAQDMLSAGATLIQLYTGFIYEGPGLVKRINKSIVKQLQTSK